MSTSCIDHGQKGNKGYGQTTRKGKRRALHRAVFVDTHGIPWESIADQVVRHTCDNPRCINPEHLVLGTQADNVRDMWSRSRQGDYRRFGEDNGRTVLSEEAKATIRSRFTRRCPINGGKALAKEFGVTPARISQVVREVA